MSTAVSSSSGPLMGGPTRATNHRCLMSEVKTKKAIAGSITCKPGEAALLPVDKVKLHYVVHYLHRGAFDRWVPEAETEEEKSKVDMYICNVCNRKFRNNLAKREYPARGSIICHLATEHGKVLDVMRDDAEVDMTPAIDLIVKHDAAMRKFDRDGTATKHGDKLVKVIKASLAMINSIARAKSPEKAAAASASPKPAYTVNKEPAAPTTNAASAASYLFSCPKCKEFRPTRERSALRFHLIEHYVNVWSDKLDPLLPTDALEHNCTGCRKRVSGSTPRGLRNAVVVHWALQHGQLADELRKDPQVEDELIQRLEKTDAPTFRTRNSEDRLQIFDKNFKANQKSIRSPGGKKATSPTKKKGRRRPDDDTPETTTSEEETTTPSSDGSEQESRSPIKKIKKKPGPKSKTMSGTPNPLYVRKRSKIDFTLDSDGDDSDEWTASKKVKRKRRESESGSEGSRRSSRPRRATSKAVVYQGEGEEEDEEAVEEEGL